MLCANKVLCHCAEAAESFWYCNHDCVFCNVIGGWKILCGKQSTLMKPKKSVEHYQTLSSCGCGLGTRLLKRTLLAIQSLLRIVDLSEL